MWFHCVSQCVSFVDNVFPVLIWFIGWCVSCVVVFHHLMCFIASVDVSYCVSWRLSFVDVCHVLLCFITWCVSLRQSMRFVCWWCVSSVDMMHLIMCFICWRVSSLDVFHCVSWCVSLRQLKTFICWCVSFVDVFHSVVCFMRGKKNVFVMKLPQKRGVLVHNIFRNQQHPHQSTHLPINTHIHQTSVRGKIKGQELQHTATHCNTLQHTATQTSFWRHVERIEGKFYFECPIH